MGEILQSIFSEVAGTDDENRRIAALPAKATKLGIGLGQGSPDLSL